MVDYNIDGEILDFIPRELGDPGIKALGEVSRDVLMARDLDKPIQRNLKPKPLGRQVNEYLNENYSGPLALEGFEVMSYDPETDEVWMKADIHFITESMSQDFCLTGDYNIDGPLYVHGEAKNLLDKPDGEVDRLGVPERRKLEGNLNEDASYGSSPSRKSSSESVRL